MIIWGDSPREKTIGTGQFDCPRCNLRRTYSYVRLLRYFHLYFIPLWQNGTQGEFVRCQSCGETFGVEALRISDEGPSPDAPNWIIKGDAETVAPVEVPRHDMQMGTQFTQLNRGWNAEPNAPHTDIRIEGTSLILTFLANPFQFSDVVQGQVIRLRFDGVWRYAVGDVNDEGWYRGQCRFSKLAPSWGEFYEVRGDLRLEEFHAEWNVVCDPPQAQTRHFLFYFRDENFECDAESWVRLQ